MFFTPDPQNDPNEAYELRPKAEREHGPRGWWEVTCNGVVVYSGPDKADMERLATDPAYRQSIWKPRPKLLWDR